MATNRTAPSSRVDDLLSRMRAGDREAVGEFISEYGDRIRRRVRPRLGTGVRRLFDSQDIVSTVARRLDAYISAGKLRATEDGQLWALVFRMAQRAVLDKATLCARLRRCESEDAMLARPWVRRVEALDRDLEVDIEIERAMSLLDDDRDRQILALWLHETPSHEVGQLIGIPAGTVRWRWSQIRDTLRRALTEV